MLIQLAIMIGLGACAPHPVEIVNHSFETPAGKHGAGRYVPLADVPGWSTPAAAEVIEFWGPGNAWANRGREVVAADGEQFIELDATEPVVLYQDVTTVPGTLLRWSVAHRARNIDNNEDIDLMYVLLGAPGREAPMIADGAAAPYLAADDSTWTTHTGGYMVPAGQTVTRFVLRPLSNPGESHGNFVDDVRLAVTGCAATPGPPPGSSLGGVRPATLPATGIPHALVASGVGLVVAGLALRAVRRRPHRP